MSESSKSSAKGSSKLAKPSVGIPKLTTKQNLTSASSASIASNMTKSVSTVNLNPDDLGENLNGFKINDRVWVNGTKPGYIAFIGETQFKEGVWAGIVLDSNDGKNNGTINNVTYFKTEENRGVFCRLNKLTKAPADSNQEPTKQTERADGLKIGCRVMIVNSDGSSKCGVLRYIGETEFAKGEWAGVELDEKLGKNDGSVANKRYFQCEPLFGVFAPAHKVQLENSREAKTVPKAIASSTPRSGAKLGSLANKHSGSRESLISEKSSIVSAASAANKSSIQQKLVPKSQNTPNTALASTKKPATTSVNVVQQSLKEKESHIAQLLKERDFERAEFTRAAQKFEETETRLAEYIKLIEEKNDEIVRLNQIIGQLDDKKETLLAQSVIDKSKIEDLEFQIEEQKLGCLSSDEQSEPKIPQTDANDQENALVKQLEHQKETITKHQEEIKLLKEEIEKLNVQNKTLLLAQEVYTNEKDGLTEKIKLMEENQTKSLANEQETLKLREQMSQKEKEFEDKCKLDQDKISSLTDQLADLKNRISVLENERSDLEFENEESKVKASELLKRIEQIKLEQIDNSKQADVEFALEEHKVMVQELEAKLTKQTNEREELENKFKTKFELLNEEVKCLMDKNSNSLSEQEALKNLVDQKDKQIEEINTKLLALNQVNDKLSEKEATISDLNSKIESVNKQINEKNEALAKLEKDLEQVNLEKDSSDQKNTQTMEDLNNLNQKVTLELQNLNEKHHLLEKQLEETKNYNSELQSRLNEFIQNAGDNSTQLSSLNIQLKEKDDQIEDLRSKLANNQQELNRIKDENISQEKQFSDTTNQLNSLNESLAQKDTLIQELKSNNSSIQKDLDNLRAQMKSNDKTRQDLCTQTNQLKSELEQTQKKYNELLESQDSESKQMSEKLVNLTSSLAQKDAFIQEIESKWSIVEAQKEKVSTELENLKKEYELVKQSQQTLQTNLAESTRSLTDQEKEVAKLGKEKADLVAQMENLVKEKQDLENKLVVEKNQNEQIQSKLNKLTTDLEDAHQNATSPELINQLNNEIETLGDKFKQQESKETQLKDEYESTIKDLKDMIKDSFEENEQLNLQITNLKSKFGQFEEEIKTSKEVIDRFEIENSELKAEIFALRQKCQDTGLEKKSKYKLVTELKPLPRLYCDICDMFDLHDTEDCPQQSSSNPNYPDPRELATHSKHNFEKDSNRLYCDECEMFGHDEAECPNQKSNVSDEEF